MSASQEACARIASTMVKQREKRFLDELENLFTGANVEGDSGFVNLMHIKREYFRSVRPILMGKINERTKQDTSFREELFDKLYTFFHRYFCESGSIYFRHLPSFSKIYERIYTDDRDVVLSWKTQMLYYVKSDIIIESIPVELTEEGTTKNTKRFYFDVSELEHKRNNEKQEFVFTFDKVRAEKEKVIHLKVTYSQQGKKTKLDEIIRASKKAGVRLNEDHLKKAISVFRQQTEVDYFINKDAKKFLCEQFDLWLYQYMFHEETVFEQKRLSQLQEIQNTAYDIIDFISQFEDELRRMWEKPKFVRNVNYVVTLDKLNNSILKKLTKHRGASAQVKEWQTLRMVNEQFSMKTIFKNQGELGGKNGITGSYKFLPLDTKHFKSLELEILADLGNLDEGLDGELVHSENWQALNTLQRRYKGKVKCVYIDPPFNLESSDMFDYRTNYKDSCWATILENRLNLARGFMSDDGGIFVRCDYNGNWIVRCLLDMTFGSPNHRNEIVVKRTKTLKGENKRFSTSQDSLFLYSKTNDFAFFGYRTLKPKEKWKWVDMHLPGSRKNEELLYREFFGKKIKAPAGRRWTLGQDALNDAISRGLVKMDETTNEPKFLTKYETLGSNWLDINGYAKDWKFTTENSEMLLERCLKSLTEKNHICCDFFSGSGTTQSVAQKLGRKWLGVEMGEHFYAVILPRMKKVLSGHSTGISPETNYKGGGIFKYYSLEQYEETLRNSHYDDGKQLELDSAKSPFEQYAFFGDDKLTHAIKPLKSGKLKINLRSLYPDIDIAESLANILGKQIRKRTVDTVIFSDGSKEKIDPTTMTEKEKRHFVSLIKPYLWWGK